MLVVQKMRFLKKYIKLTKVFLITFQSRIYNKVMLFAHGIKTISRSPLKLKSSIEIEVPDEEQPETKRK